MIGVTRRQLFATTTLGTVAGVVTAPGANAAKATSSPLSRSRFSGLVGATFTLSAGSTSWTARLDAVKDLVGAPAGSDSRFSLSFSASRAGGPDGTYSLSRPGFAATTIFLVGAPARTSWVATVNRV